MNIADFHPDTVYVIYIAATPEKVWQALTSAQFSRQYFFGFAVEIEPKIGGAFAVRAPNGSLHIEGKVIAYDPPRKLTVTWNVTWPGLVDKLGQTLVTYEIEQAGDAIRLTMTESHERVPRRRYSLRWTGRLAGDPLQPEKPARNRPAALDEDGATAAHAGGAQEARNPDARLGRVRMNREISASWVKADFPKQLRDFAFLT